MRFHFENLGLLDQADIVVKGRLPKIYRVLKNKELEEIGEYHTQRLVLATWNQLQNGELH